MLFLISFTWVSVGEINCAAVSEAVTAEDMVHYDIVLVGVDSDAACPGECPVEEGFGCIMPWFRGCYTMNYMIGIVIESAAFDMCISRVWPWNECHRGYDAFIIA